MQEEAFGGPKKMHNAVEGALGRTPKQMQESKMEQEYLKISNFLTLLFIKYMPAHSFYVGMCNMLNNTLKIHPIGMATFQKHHPCVA